MNLAVITLPDCFEGETSLVNSLFFHGLGKLHLRKPGAGKEMLSDWIREIRPEYRKRIVLHDYHDLAREFSLGGIHLNGRNPKAPEWLDRKEFTVSRSCHSIQEIRENLAECDYLFLSPVFDSISKEGYGAAFSPSSLREAAEEGLLKDKVYALGGISTDNLEMVREMGFKGAAVLGGLWQAAQDGKDGILLRFDEYLRLCRSL